MGTRYVRNFTILCKDLDVDTTLAFMFAKQGDDQYKDVRSVVWRVTQFGKNGSYSIKDTFVNEYAFMKLQVNEGGQTLAATHVAIGMNQKTTLSKEMQHFVFSPPETVAHPTDQPPKVINKTGFVEDIYFGFKQVSDPDSYVPVLAYKSVGQDLPVAVAFKPILQIFSTSQYSQGQVVVQPNSDPIAELPLDELKERTFWELHFDAAQGTYRLVPVETHIGTY